MNFIYRAKGMHCRKCVAKIIAALETVPGIGNAWVDLDTEIATFTAPAEIDLITLNGALAQKGEYTLNKDVPARYV